MKKVVPTRGVPHKHFKQTCQRYEKVPKDAANDVNKIKDFLRSHIGTTYLAATQPSDANLLAVDMSDWGGLRTPRGSAPFNQIRNAQTGYRAYVLAQLTKLCPWQHWS